MSVFNLERLISGEQSQEQPLLDLLLFRLERETYAIPSSSVREIIRHRTFTPVPGAPPTLPGIISQRGAILPIVEIRTILGLPEDELTRSARMVIVQHSEIDMVLLVEQVFDLVSLEAQTVEAPPSALDPARARFIQGIARYEDRPVALLDLDIVISALREGS